MTPQDRQLHFFNRVLSDPAEIRPRWFYPFERVANDPRNTRNRSLAANELSNIPIEQQQPAYMNEDQWTRYLRNEIEAAWRPTRQQNKTIYSVPKALFEVRPRAYCPRMITIGPLCRKLEPSPMDNCKALCVKEFIGRKAMELQELTNHVVTEPDNLRNIYFGLPKYNSETLKLLLTVDSVFIHEFLLFLSKDLSSDDPTFGYLSSFINNQITLAQVTRDLFLVGNQVPISFLKSLTGLPNEDITSEDLLLCLEFLVWRSNPFCMSHPGSTTPHQDLKALIGQICFLDCEHLLDCLYAASVGYSKEECSKEFNKPSCRLPQASELSRVGIKFRGRKGNSNVVKYHKRSLVLELPKLVIYDETEDILRNLIAYELTSKAGGEFCGYAIIMDSLIDTSEDLAIMYRAGVLENHLGSDERLLRMWNEMCINISESYSERWEKMTKAILMHYKSNWRVMYVEFYSKFFSRPWLWLSTLAAVLLLIMSALQTVYTVAGFYKS